MATEKVDKNLLLEAEAKIAELESKLADPEGYVKSLETKVADLETSHAEKVADLETSHAEKVAELEKTIAEQDEVIEALQEEIKSKDKTIETGNPTVTVDKVDYAITPGNVYFNGKTYSVKDLIDNVDVCREMIKINSQKFKALK